MKKIEIIERQSSTISEFARYDTRPDLPTYEIIKEHHKFYTIETLSQAQNFIAKSYGYKDWHDLQKSNPEPELENTFIEYKPIQTRPFKILDFQYKNVENESFSIGKKTGFLNKKDYIINPNESIISFSENQKGIYYSGTSFNAILSEYNLKQNKGLIQISDKGGTTIFSEFKIAKYLRDDDVYLIYLNNKINDRPSDTINPMDVWAISQKTFFKSFNEDVAIWLYPAFKSYWDNGETVTISSMKSFLSLEQIIRMAKSNDWNNQSIIQDTLKKLDIDIDPNQDLKTLNEKQLNKYHNLTRDALNFCIFLERLCAKKVISENPTINLMHIFKRAKILFSHVYFEYKDIFFHKFITLLISGIDELQTQSTTFISNISTDDISLFFNLKNSVNQYFISALPNEQNIQQIDNVNIVIFSEHMKSSTFYDYNLFLKKLVSETWNYNNFPYIKKLITKIKNSDIEYKRKKYNNIFFDSNITINHILNKKDKTLLKIDNLELFEKYNFNPKKINTLKLKKHIGGIYE